MFVDRIGVVIIETDIAQTIDGRDGGAGTCDRFSRGTRACLRVDSTCRRIDDRPRENWPYGGGMY